MRIYLRLSPNRLIVPFDYQVNMVGALHKWLGGRNETHDSLSLYSFSWLQGGHMSDSNGLDFPEGARWFISAHDPSLIKKIISGILDSPEVAFGMQVEEITIRETPVFSSPTRFFLGSPILVKRNMEKDQRYYLYHEEESDSLMTETLQRKLAAASLPTVGVSVRFLRQHPGAKTKLCTYKGIKNKASYCPIIIEGSPEQISFAWDVGIGNSTGIGFGSLI